MADTDYSIQEAADLLGFPVQKLRRWDKQGVLVALRTDGGHRRYPRELIDRMAANTSASADEKLAGELHTTKRALAENRRIVQLLSESEGRYRDLVETSHDVIWAANAQGSLTYINDAAREIFGLAPADMLGCTLFDFEAERSHVSNRRFLALLGRSGEIRDYIVHIQSANGEDRWLGINAQVTTGTKGEIRGMRGTARDITRLQYIMRDVDLLAKQQPGFWARKHRGLTTASTDRARSADTAVYSGESLRTCLDNDRLTLFAQPVVRLSDRKVMHHEILLRIRGADGNYVLPSPFIGAAESLGLVQEVDMRVVSKLIEFIGNHGATTSQPHYFVNLSPMSIANSDWVAGFLDLLRGSAVNTAQLVFEISETAALAEVDATLSFIRRLKDTGSGFALDGFGAGFGSFYYLKRFDADYLKIDGRFVRDIVADEGSRIFVKALNDVARGMQKQVIAGWVEDTAALDTLLAVGAEYGQGYLFQRPQLLAA